MDDDVRPEASLRSVRLVQLDPPVSPATTTAAAGGEAGMLKILRRNWWMLPLAAAVATPEIN
jgi:hypothetical protein